MHLHVVRSAAASLEAYVNMYTCAYRAFPRTKNLGVPGTPSLIFLGSSSKFWGPYLISVRSRSNAYLQSVKNIPMYTTDVLFYGFKSENFVRVKKTRHEYKRKTKPSFVIFGVPRDPKGFIFGVHSRILGSGTPILGSGKALRSIR